MPGDDEHRHHPVLEISTRTIWPVVKTTATTSTQIVHEEGTTSGPIVRAKRDFTDVRKCVRSPPHWAVRRFSFATQDVLSCVT